MTILFCECRRAVGRFTRPWLGLAAAVCSAACGLGHFRAAPAADPAAVLDLPHGGFLAGELLDSPGIADAPPPAGDRPPLVLWRAAGFESPFQFPLAAVHGIRFPEPGDGPPAPAGGWRLALVGGDELVCDLEAIDAERVAVRVPAAVAGPDAATVLKVRRTAVRSIHRETPADSLPRAGGLRDWRPMPPDGWRQEGGRLVSVAGRAKLCRDVPPPRARYDITISWEGRPSVEIGFGVDDKVDAAAPFRVVLGTAGVAAVRDEIGTGDAARARLERLCDLPEGRLEVSVFIDRQAGRMVVTLPDADGPAADLTVPPARDRAASGFRLAVSQGRVALDDFRVSAWGDDDVPTAAARAGDVRLRDGRSLAGVVARLDTADAAIELAPGAAAEGTQKIPLTDVASIRFPAAVGRPAEEAPAAPRGGPGAVQVNDRRGSRLTGGFLRVERGVLWIEPAGFDGPLPMPVATLATLTIRERAAAPPAKLPGRIGRIRMPQAEHRGCLVPGTSSGGSTATGSAAVAWQPLGSLTASPLSAAAVAGPGATIDYVEPPPPGKGPERGGVGGVGCSMAVADGRPIIGALLGDSAAAAAGVAAGDIVLAIAPRGDGRFVETAGLSLDDVSHLMRGRAGSTLQLRLGRPDGASEPRDLAIVRRPLPQLGRNPQMLRAALDAHDRLVPPLPAEDGAAAAAAALLILRSGETVACAVESLGEAGVVVRLPGREPVTVPHAAVRAVELLPAAGRPLSADKFRGLTTLPRSQETEPPTHLVRSPGGDYLRGRVVSLDAATLRIAIDVDPRGKPAAVPRHQIARVIWLHPEDMEAAAKPDTPAVPPAAAGLPVEGVRPDGGRLRMTATAIDGDLLSGDNPILGGCGIDLATTDRLLVGGAIAADAEARPLPYSQWRLRPATEPRNLPSRRKAVSQADAGPAP